MVDCTEMRHISIVIRRPAWKVENARVKLVISDLDQTLVDLISLHDETIHRVFREMFDVEASLYEIDYPGQSLRYNLAVIARLKGIPSSLFQKKSDEMLRRYEASFVRHFPKNAARYLLPGAESLLRELAASDSIVSLYTGNSRRIGAKVLSGTGLARYFRFTLYGTEVTTRAEMVRIAAEKAEELAGKPFQGKDIVIIGDSIRDIDVGRHFGALTIAVATGAHTETELREHQPDYLLEDLSNPRQVTSIINQK